MLPTVRLWYAHAWFDPALAVRERHDRRGPHPWQECRGRRLEPADVTARGAVASDPVPFVVTPTMRPAAARRGKVTVSRVTRGDRPAAKG